MLRKKKKKKRVVIQYVDLFYDTVTANCFTFDYNMHTVAVRIKLQFTNHI